MRNGLIGMPNLTRTRPRYQTHYLHTRSRGGREQRERNGQKAAKGEGDTRIQRPVKNVGQNTPVPLYFSSFFFTANSPHASRGSPAPVYKGTRVLEMMASVEKKKGRSARHVSRSDTYITLFILRLCPRKYPSFPFFNPPSRKTLTSFSPFLFALFAILPLPAYPRYISTGSRHSDPEIHLEVLPK